MTRIHFVFIVIFGFGIITEGFTQSTSSPYSLFGAGEVENNGFGINRAMGGTGIAFKSGAYLNSMNPASYSGIDSLSFLLELGFALQHSIYTNKSETQSITNGNFQYLSMGFRMKKFWHASLGLVPYSSMGYNINVTGEVEGDLTEYTTSFSGDGGINRFYFGNAFSPIKGLSLGVNFSYLFGTLVKTESATFSDLSFAYELENTNYIRKVYMDYGLQYTLNLGDWDYTLGATYAAKSRLSSTTKTVFNTSDTSIVVDKEKTSGYYIPQSMGIGFAIQNGDRFRMGVDYEQRDWSDIQFDRALLATRDSRRYSAGLEFKPEKSVMDSWFKKVYYRFGASYSQSYLEIKGVPIDSKSVSFGMGIPVRNGRNTINWSVEYGQNGTTKKKLIREDYILFNLNITLNDVWFQKFQYK